MQQLVSIMTSSFEKAQKLKIIRYLITVDFPVTDSIGVGNQKAKNTSVASGTFEPKLTSQQFCQSRR
jgi:hypothetical protein